MSIFSSLCDFYDQTEIMQLWPLSSSWAKLVKLITYDLVLTKTDLILNKTDKFW